MLFNGRNDAIKFIGNYSSMILEAKRKVIKGEGLKILSPLLNKCFKEYQ